MKSKVIDMEIFTIGHSNYPMEKFIEMLRKYNINCVVDARETPYSKYNIQYNKESLQSTLKKEGFVYIYMGRELGARNREKESYTKEKYVDFEKAVTEEIFINAVERLRKGCEMGYKIAILGAMQEPIRCHRSIFIGRYLSKVGFNVKYILHEGNLAGEEYIEECLLDKYFTDRNQLSIDSLLGNNLSREDMIKEGYRMANKEIGYRSENIGKEKE